MDTVLQATVNRIKAFVNESDTSAIKSDLEYTANSIFKQETKASLISTKFIQTLFSLFNNDSLSSSHYVLILQITQKLAVLRSARTVITTYIPNIANLLKSESDSVRLNSCKLVSTCCLFDDSINTISDSEITQILYDLLFDDDQDIVSETLKALSFVTNYIRSTPENVIVRLIQILSKTDKFEVIRCDNALKVLSNICAEWEMKEVVIKHNVIKSVAKFLSTSYAQKEEAVSRSASGLLMMISVCESGKESLLSNKAIIAALCYLVSNKSIDSVISKNSGIAICNIGDHPKGLLIVGKELIHKHALLITLFGGDKAAKIGFALMQNENAFVQQSALQILALILQQKDGVDAVWRCKNILRALIDVFMMAEKDRVVAIALNCIIMICQKNKAANIILRGKARQSKTFFQTAKKIVSLQPFVADELM